MNFSNMAAAISAAIFDYSQFSRAQHRQGRAMTFTGSTPDQQSQRKLQAEAKRARRRERNTRKNA